MFWKKQKIIVTHDSGFHTDDIFACATILIYLENRGEKYKIIRTRDLSVINKGDFVFDVGGVYDKNKNRFDHHQKGGAGVHENGIPFAAFGLVWEKFGKDICGDSFIAKEIERKLVLPIDANDNGIDVFKSNIENISPVTFQDITGLYYPEEGASGEEYLNAFLSLVSLAKNIIKKSILKSRKQFEVNNYMLNLYNKSSDKRFIVVDKKYGRFAVSMGALNLEELLYVVYPSVKDASEWNVVATRKSIDTMESKKPFPEIWAGLNGQDLERVSSVLGAKFCHNGRFLCTASTRDGAISIAKNALNN